LSVISILVLIFPLCSQQLPGIGGCLMAKR